MNDLSDIKSKELYDMYVEIKEFLKQLGQIAASLEQNQNQDKDK